MNTKFIALVSALATTAAMASTVEAGGGVRLGFGVPLGSFVATPAHGGGSYHKPKMKKTPAAHVARKPQKPAPRVAKAEKADAAPKKTKITETKPETAAEEKATVTGSSALIQGSIPAEEPAAAAPEAATTEVEAEAETPSKPAVTAQAPDESENCKKFIPAVGMTVSVGCE